MKLDFISSLDLDVSFLMTVVMWWTVFI